MDYVRVSISANELKKSVSEYLQEKVPPLAKERELRNSLARLYGNVVTPFVPRSNLSDSRHHLQTFQVSDGRVKWYRIASNGPMAGEEIAGLLYEGPITGEFRSRASGGNSYGAHTPEPYWDENVRPGTPAWEGQFIPDATDIIINYFVTKGVW